MLKRKSWSPSVFKLDFPHQSNTFLVADVLVAQFDGWPCLYLTILTAKWGWDSMFEFLVVHGVVTRPCLHNNHWTTNSRTRWFAVLGPWQRGKWGRLSCTMKAQFHMAKSLSSLPTYIWRLDRLHCRCFFFDHKVVFHQAAPAHQGDVQIYTGDQEGDLFRVRMQARRITA